MNIDKTTDPADIVYAYTFNDGEGWLPTNKETADAFKELRRRATIDARLSTWLRTAGGGSVLITKGGVSLCWHDPEFQSREVNIADNALDPLDLGQRATLIERALNEAEKLP